MLKFKVNGQSFPNRVEQTNGQTDGQTDEGDCMTSLDNVIGNDYLCMTRLTLLPDATISCLACSCCSSSEGLLLICKTASPGRSPAFSAKLPGFTYKQTSHSQLTAKIVRHPEPATSIKVLHTQGHLQCFDAVGWATGRASGL